MIGLIIKNKLKNEIDPRTGENFDINKDITLQVLMNPEQKIYVDGKEGNANALGEIKKAIEKVREMTGFDSLDILEVALKKGSPFASLTLAGVRRGEKIKESVKL
jgi:ribosomal protein S7